MKIPFFKSRVLVAGIFLLASAAGARTFLLDFGAVPTPDAPDINGNHWNNVNEPVLHYLVDTKKEYAGIGLDFETNYAVGKNGGLENPAAKQLGNLAVPTATSDYFYNATSSNCTFKLTNLDALSSYSIRIFASRNAQDKRVTTYTVEGGNGTFTVDLQTSGKGVSSEGSSGGNDGNVAELKSLKPNVYGQLKVSYGTKSGSFSYIGAMELVVEPVGLVK
ncbi:hypothetical protein P4B35_08865 [Pontiellaceae bacterium B12227]|nr:hypothetical protein [Pontiellaceae bacterium B12227]